VLPDDQPPVDDALAAAVRRVYVRPVDERTASEHVSAIVAAAAEPATHAVAAPSARRRRGWRVGLAAGAATLLLPVGLAAAGVTLPDAVEQPFKAVGIELPNQPRPEPPAPATPAARPPAPRLPAVPPAAKPLAPAVPASAKPLAPARPAPSRPQSGRGRASGAKPAVKPAPPQSRRDRAPARATHRTPAKPKTTHRPAVAPGRASPDHNARRP
jgi:hypothetical protein